MTELSNHPRFVFILGMHRSGTSCLAGSLERCGLFLGAVSHRAQSNPKDFLYELKDAVRLHRQILVANGGSWRWPPSHIEVSPQQKQTIKKISSRLARHTPCGIKDPRLLLLLDTWLEVVDSYALVGTFRHPAAVARSLVTRNPKLTKDIAYALWARYNSELVRWHKIHPFPIVEFGLTDVETYCKAVAILAADLGLYPDIDRLREFVSPDINRNSTKEPIPTVCQEAYTYLLQHRYQPVIPDNDLEARLLAAQQRYNGWRWSPNRFRQALHLIAQLAPPSLAHLGERWFRRLEAYKYPKSLNHNRKDIQ